MAVASPYGLDKPSIVSDLSAERPQWILSAYGPGRGAPAQLFGGPQREQSFEELRLLHYMGLASGNPQSAVQEADKIYQAAEQQVQTALNDVDGAINYIIKAENEHPNRTDICRESQAASAGSQRGVFQRTQEYPISTPSQPAAAPAFGAPSQAGAFGQAPGGAFGQSPALGQKPSPFGAPSGPFGQPSGGGFGQASALGQKPNPFGAPTAFGAPTGHGGGGAFGQPSALGQKPNPFGAPSGAFGQPSGVAFGQPSASGQKPNPFGGQPAAPAPFGGTLQPQTNPFGVPSTQNPNPFGAQNPPTQPNPFGNTPRSFGAPSPAPKNPFGGPATTQPSPWGAAPAASSPFSNPQPTVQPASNPLGNPQPVSQPAANPFGNPTPSAPTQPNANPFGGPPPTQQQSQPFTNGSTSLTDHPSLSQYSTRDGNGRLLTWKDKRVIYKDGEPGTQSSGGPWQKIWFPNGPPPPNKWAEAEPEQYTDEVKNAYEYARRNGGFEGGMIPLIPPKQEWCQWDF